jgi:transcriptional regulator
MAESRSELLKGTLDLLVLKSLEYGSMHGWGLAIRIEQTSGGVFTIHQGALFPALQRLTRKGMINSDWRMTENNRRARYYTLTPAGRRQLVRKITEWERVVGGVSNVLHLRPQEG